MNSITRTHSQSAPILSLFDHLTDTVNNIEDPQTCLEGVNRFVQVRGGLLALQERAFLVDKTVTSLRDARVKRGDLVTEDRRVGLDREQGRD